MEELVRKRHFKLEKRKFFHTIDHILGFKGTVVYQACNFLNRGHLESVNSPSLLSSGSDILIMI